MFDGWCHNGGGAAWGWWWWWWWWWLFAAWWCAQAAVAAMVKTSVAAFGEEIHVLVNNAAYFCFHSVEHASAADWDKTCAVNIKGHALVTKAVLPHMK
jgi:NAD(P)-dependent dehydrogenase (short-subunit alcohol dehydrogenase family)